MNFIEASINMVGLKYLSELPVNDLLNFLHGHGFLAQVKDDGRLFVRNSQGQFISVSWSPLELFTKMMMLGFVLFGDKWFGEMAETFYEVFQDIEYRKSHPLANVFPTE